MSEPTATAAKLPGVRCPVCHSVKRVPFRTVRTTYRGTSTIRFKRCTACGHVIRTKEVVESAQTGRAGQ